MNSAAFLRLLLPCLLLAACHDARRTNPFDPDLTPAVDGTSVAVDTTAGTALIAWQPYSGRQPFAAYRVLRKVQGFEAWDTLAVVADPAAIQLADTTLVPETSYLYRVDALNTGGYAAIGAEVPATAFSVRPAELIEVQGDGVNGHIDLRWHRYRGPDFERYEIWRRRFGQDPDSLHAALAVADTTWSDTTPLPATDYSYWIITRAAGRTLGSIRLDGGFTLPPVDLSQVVLSSTTADAHLQWSRYQGPRFAAYEIRRSIPGQAEEPVAIIGALDSTAFTDPRLDGNTTYTYRIFVRTTWGDDIGVLSEAASGIFYRLEEIVSLPRVDNAAVQALALAFDTADGLYIASTQILTTTARTMTPGVRLKFPDSGTYRNFFSQFTPNRLSPLRLAVHEGAAYVTFHTQEGDVLVGGVGADRSSVWSFVVDTGGEDPVGLYVNATGTVHMVDTQGVIYAFDSAGDSSSTDQLNVTLTSDTALPIRDLVVGRGIESGLDVFFLLAPDRPENHIVGRLLIDPDLPLLGGRALLYDDGVGPEDGQTLSPLVMAFDVSQTRLVVLEELGRLQVLDAREEVARELQTPRYITKWGRFGSAAGEFLVSPPTAVAVAVDSHGRIHVADAQGGAGRLQIFTP